MTILQPMPITMGTRVARLGGSVDARESVIILTKDGSSSSSRGVEINTTTNIATVRTPSAHLLHSDAYVLLSNGGGPGSSNFDKQVTIYGQIDIVDTTTFTIRSAYTAPLPPPGNNYNTTPFDIHILARFSPMCLHRELNALCNGALRLVSNFSTGSHSAAQLLNRVDAITSTTPPPDIVMGSFGFGNTITNLSKTVDQCYSDMVGIINALKAKNVAVILEVASGIYNPTDQSNVDLINARAERLVALLRDYAQRENPDLAIVDPTDWTVVSNTGQGNTTYLRATTFVPPSTVTYDSVHPNRVGERRRAPDVFEVIRQIIPIPLLSPLSKNTTDRQSRNVNSTNIYAGGWDATGQGAAVPLAGC